MGNNLIEILRQLTDKPIMEETGKSTMCEGMYNALNHLICYELTFERSKIRKVHCINCPFTAIVNEEHRGRIWILNT